MSNINTYIDIQQRLLNNIITLLKTDAYISSLVGTRISTEHISYESNPIYPLVTVSRSGLGSDSGIAPLDDAFIVIDVWSSKSVVELWKIYAYQDTTVTPSVSKGIKSLLDHKTIDWSDITAGVIREMFVQDNLYQPWDKKFHLTARYHILSVSQMIS